MTRTAPGTRQVLKYLSTGLVKKCIFESPPCSKHNHHSKLPQRRYREHPTAHTDHPRGQHYSRGLMRSARKGQSGDSDPGARRSVFPTLGLPLMNPLTRDTHSSGGGVRSAVCCSLVLLTEVLSVQLRCTAVSLRYTLPCFTAHLCTVCLSRLPGKYRPQALRPGCPW